MPLILPGNVASALPTGFNVANSCRFNDGDSAYMHKSQSNGDEDHYTISMWIKRGQLGVNFIPLWQCIVDGSNGTYACFYSDDTLEWVSYTSNATKGTKRTNRKFRDVSAWYHLVFRYDSDNSTAGDRMRLYVNGVEETSWGTDTSPSSGQDHWVNESSCSFSLGYDTAAILGGSATYFDGYMAEVCLIDGSGSLAPTSFGEFDSDSPTIWKPIDVSGLTFGTNGFYLDFEASANLGNDANGGTDLTEVNLAATDQATDSPTNNWATWNSISIGPTGYITFSEGNTALTATTQWRWGASTLAANKGKWYMEIKQGGTDGSEHVYYGIGTVPYFANVGAQTLEPGSAPIARADVQIYASRESTGQMYTNSGTTSGTAASYLSSWDEDDIIGIQMDLDNQTMAVAVNNSWGADISIIADEYFQFCMFGYQNGTTLCNFGNPAYANSSDAADADGYGAFEYAPPSGFFALNTKNLAEYG